VQHRARATITADQQGLEALAALAGEALGRLRLTTQMSHLAHHDVLTALPNRALFLDRAEHAMLMARRRNSRLAVMFCDLDGFKRVNDRLGHATGDELLVEVARRIRTCLRDSDTVARLGGDEFAILLEDLEGEGRVQTACSRVLAVLRERIALSEHLVSVSTSIGVAYSETAETAEGLLRNADMAMYQAKAQGKDRCSTYEPALGRARVRKLELVEALRNAIEQRQVEVAYQPVVELHSRAIVGVEALARWSYNGVPIAPDLFIGAAEDSGLVTALGDLMFDLVLADAPRLRDAAGATFEMGVNISASSCVRTTCPPGYRGGRTAWRRLSPARGH
jgi:diguanylate cyclase (GGDEF)-like protein